MGVVKSEEAKRDRINISLNKSTIELLKTFAKEQETNVSQLIEKWALEKKAEQEKLQEKKKREEQREQRRMEKLAKEQAEQKKAKRTRKTTAKTEK